MLTEKKSRSIVKTLFSKKKRGDDVYIPSNNVFGVSLSENAMDIPFFVVKCVEYLRKRAPGCEGIFRLSPPFDILEDLSHKLNSGENIDFNRSIASDNKPVTIDPHIVGGLLKKYFRELPQPLCTAEMYDMWIAAVSIKDEPTLKNQVKKVLQFLPLINLKLLKYLTEFLRYLSKFSDKTKMTTNNLSICFAPNILRPPENVKVVDQLEESPIGTTLLELLINDYDFFFDENTNEVMRKKLEALTSRSKLSSGARASVVGPVSESGSDMTSSLRFSTAFPQESSSANSLYKANVADTGDSVDGEFPQEPSYGDRLNGTDSCPELKKHEASQGHNDRCAGDKYQSSMPPPIPPIRASRPKNVGGTG